MKKFIYIFMVLSLALNFCSCGGGSGEPDPDPEPNPDPTPGTETVKVGFTLKSGVGNLDDAGLKGIISHVRLYVFDQAGKLQKS